MESSASVATLASVSSIASTSAAARAALKARPYMVPPFVATASAPPTPQPHTSNTPSTSTTARTAPATPTRRRIAPEEDLDLVEDFDVALAQLEEPQPHAKAKSQRFFWRKAIRRVFQRRK